ncbi:sushi, von Willebrand factor type A, EGF and pentraxin domain-containing protein 1-like [Ruditapes philippinarum]|uniref:sushi, von Willebrand factor type A, EGF and pentraxin domain-containing protein 1-like n=1 Tax=Ruditapes philippinarum TaxID=129788 RepID=UPI00295B87C7|nr:sushi, von Willebrand factor type A, EGF and pentraxin domain-containing protein 1-like [Ruditapes philippinarum]
MSLCDCGSPLNVSNGNLLYTATTFGSTASLVCDRGYDGNGTISCLDTGSWETPPICSVKDCGSPLNVSNGNLLYTATTFGSTASLVCDRGYDGNGTISCLDTGSWETPPICSVKDCGSPLNVSNGNLNYTATTFGSTASLVCDKGFGYDGNGTISCLNTGSWETPPNCSVKGVECPEGWTSFEKSCYLFVEELMTWEAAKNKCESIKGYLVEINSASENTFFKETIGDAYVWLGLNDIQKEGEFVWEYSGATFDISEVGKGINFNSEITDCVYHGYASKWLVELCDFNKNYMCEISPKK